MVWGSVFETSRTLEGKHVRQSLRHGVTAHNWFAHYLCDIYGGFGHGTYAEIKYETTAQCRDHADCAVVHYQAQFLFLLEISLRKVHHKMSEDSEKATHI